MRMAQYREDTASTALQHDFCPLMAEITHRMHILQLLAITSIIMHLALYF